MLPEPGHSTVNQAIVREAVQGGGPEGGKAEVQVDRGDIKPVGTWHLFYIQPVVKLLRTLAIMISVRRELKGIASEPKGSSEAVDHTSQKPTGA